MSTWIKRNLPNLGRWHLISALAETEADAESAYLLNDIGPVLYVFNSVPEGVRERNPQ